MKTLLPFFLACALAPAAAAQIAFTDQTNLLPTPFYLSGSAVGVFDANGDGKDDIVRSGYGSTFQVNLQQAPNAAFTEQTFGTGAIFPAWGMAAGDVNNDGIADVLWCDGSAAFINATQSSAPAYLETLLQGGGYLFPQGCNIAEINGDGKADVFVCNDVDMSHIYVNNLPAAWTFNQVLIPLATVPLSDNSGNYASIFCDVNNDGHTDLYVTHCRQGVNSPSDPRRINQLFLSNGNNTYTQDVTNTSNLRIGAQSWSTGFGDIDNDGDMDAFVLNYDVESNLMLNNGSGVFSDITSSAGVTGSTTYFGMNTSFHDFDNDGFNDLLIGGVYASNGVGHRLYRNNGDNTFTAIQNLFGDTSMGAYGVGDLNRDGFLDVFASYCDVFATTSQTNTRDKVWMNNGNANGWITFNLEGVYSNRLGVGAIVKIYGPWGVQVREVRGGEGYGIQNSLACHFGMGTATMIDSVIVQWPSGIVNQLNSVAANQFLTIVETPVSTGAEPAQKELSASVLPNPLSGSGAIRIDHFAQHGLENLSLKIFDVTGKETYAEDHLSRSIIPLSGEMFPKGIYFFELRVRGERVKGGKFVVE